MRLDWLVLVGRGQEMTRLDDLVGVVRAGGSGVLVVAGDAGIGKSSLLEYAISQAGNGLRVLRARGAESERNLPFAGLADLVGPVLGYLDGLPERQAAALAGALAVGPAVPADRFAVCAATLGLLAAAAAERPVLAVVDDVHWLDAASAQAVEFTARRLGAEGLGLVVALRPHAGGSFDSARIETLTVDGLDAVGAQQLLGAAGRPAAAAVAKRLASGCGGNPLAMLELSAGLSSAQLAGAAPLPEPLPVAQALRRALAQRLAAVGPECRRVLLLAAADAASDLADLERACAALGACLADLAAAEEAGLVTMSAGRVEFTHPLLRSAAYHGASAAERRAAHTALAGAIGSGQHPVRHAWHLAEAAVGADETAAASLDAAASTAMARNAFVAASRASQRAAELTADPDRAFTRWAAAGYAAHLGGDLAAAEHTLTRALELAPDPASRADAQMLLAHATVWTAQPLSLHYRLVSQAEAALPFDRQRAATMLATAALACYPMARLDLALATAERAAALAVERGRPDWLASHAQLATANVLVGRRRTGLPLLREVAEMLSSGSAATSDLSLLSQCAQALMWCEDHELARSLLMSNVSEQRTNGQLLDLCYGLAAASELLFRTGDWGRAYADATEAVDLGTISTNAAGYALVCTARVEAAMGAQASCRAHLHDAVKLAEARGINSTLNYAAAVAGVLELGNGRYEQAVADLTRCAAMTASHGLGDPSVIQWRPDFIEALARLGRHAEAGEQLAILETEATATGSGWASAAAARCRGLLEPPGPAVETLEHAVWLAEASAGPFDQARSRMCLGQALRRGRHRGQARQQLQQALTVFQALGARPWADRAAAELVLTGATPAQLSAPLHSRLTPQELRITLQVADGLSNKEVAARLFLSPKTVEVHLGHIYDKLGIRNRTSLARLVSAGAVSEPGS